MEKLLQHIKINVNEKLYLKDPDSSELGRSIIANSITLIDEIGFEAFTFKKLGQRIDSPESSIYRYFESKHKILLYLTTWYWSWLEYKLVFSIANINSNEEKLEKAIEVLTEPVKEDSDFLYIDEITLSRIAVQESIKTYYTKEVDAEQREGLFVVYESLVQRVSDIVLAINPKFEYPHMLISTVIEGARHQQYFSEHLPSLTDKKKNVKDVSQFFKRIVFSTIGA